MSLNGNNILSGASGQTTGYDIDQSLRFDGDHSDSKLCRTPSTASNRKTFTISFWCKINLPTEGSIFDGDMTDINGFIMQLKTTGAIYFYDYYSGGAGFQVTTDRLFRDYSNWYHFLIAVDTTQSTDSNRFKFYVNGEHQDMSSWTAHALRYPAQNGDMAWNNNRQMCIGGSATSNDHADCYLAEFHSIDGQALTPASFGETNSDTNQWQAIKYAGSYGTNGFYLKFQDSSALGDDSSGNNNDFTPTNLAATDVVVDTPTNNFATLNPLDPAANHGTSTFKEGNLRIDLSGGNYKYSAVGNGAMSTGKWYFEFCAINSDNSQMLGVADITKGLDRGYTGSSGDGLYIYVDGDKYSPTANSSYGVSWTYGDVMGIAVDMDNNAMYFAKNNTWMNSGDPTSGSSKTGAAYTTELSGKTWVAAMGRGGLSNTNSGTFNFGQDSSFAGAKTAQGNTDGNDKGDFYYTPPSGYLALCSDNLSDPSIADPTKHFNTVLYSGDGTTNHAITGVGFQPDLVWYKVRSTTGHNNLYDSVRGVQKVVYSDLTNAEATSTGTQDLYAFGADGFTVGSNYQTICNTSGENFRLMELESRRHSIY